MKLQLLFITLFSALIIHAQDITVNSSLGSGYSNQLYYKLDAQIQNSYPASSWDLAFFRNSAYDMGIRVNAHTVSNVYEATNNPNDWNSIDLANESTWTVLYNDETNWQNGAFMQGSASYGWGEYNPATHHVSGTVIFVLKLSNGTYYKFINLDFYGGYTFKYAMWDDSAAAWVDETTFTLPNTTNPNYLYNYYSIQNNQSVIAEPENMDWDFVFTKYYTYYNEIQWYPVLGALHHPDIVVAENVEVGTDLGNTSNLEYHEEINTVGYDWKVLNADYQYDVDADKKFYFKYPDERLFRLYFTDFAGSSTGNLTFKFREVTDELGFENIAEGIRFSIYPNPVENKKMSVLFDNTQTKNTNIKLSLSDIKGNVVYTKDLNTQTGFYQNTFDFSNLNSGIYFVHLYSERTQKTIKIVLN